MLTLTFAAFIAGVLMFLAPCTLPIVPGYLAFIAGSPSGSPAKRNILTNACAFVLGFSILFILLGTSAAGVGMLLGVWRPILSKLAGVILIVFGITMLGIVRIPFLSGEQHIRTPSFVTLGRWESSFFLGALFAIGWSPCIGPILGTILLVSSVSATAPQGVFLLLVFSLGLGIPFILAALFIECMEQFTKRMGKITHTLSILSALLLITLGILMLLGNMGLLISWGYRLLNFVHYERLLQYM